MATPPRFAPKVRVAPNANTEPRFAAFADWLQRFEQTDKAGQAVLTEEGRALARERLTALADMVQTNPERALELALPHSVYQQLPAELRELVETPVNTRGDLAVLGTLPIGGRKGELPAVFRTATFAGETHHAFTFGQGLSFRTRDDVPLDGYVLPAAAATRPPVNPLVQSDKLFLLNPNFVRVLDMTETETVKAAADAGEPTPVVVADVPEVADVPAHAAPESIEEAGVLAESGGQLYALCCSPHLQTWAGDMVAASGLTKTSTAKSTPTSESTYTEGRKRFLLMRPYWVDQPVAMNTNSALTHYNNFSNYMYQMSYGKMKLAAIGQGSDITPEMLLTGSVNGYASGLSGNATNVWTAVRNVAQTNYGYDLSKYDFLYYVTTDRPAASYCGLGFVGGVGFHLANSCFDAAVTAHEFGHNLDLNHANFWDTAMQSIIGDGVNDEYGDNSDPMGGGGNPNHFNSRYKNWIDWIPDTDIVTIPTTGNNRYRLYAFDLDYGVGLRGLRFVRTSSQNYWVQFRQRKTTFPALMNGVQLLWTGNGDQSSYLLDVRLRGGASDNALVIGRTFSEHARNFHITPIGKGNTYPESIDVIAVTGPQPGNQPPFASIAASTLNPAPGQAVTFTATASDPNNDTLAYYWEFGDGIDSYSNNNSPTQTKSYNSAGEYAVRCVVSDMRGGIAQHSLVVRVGNPNVFRISGHVTDQYARPMVGARVTAGSRSVFVDSDGSYTIPGLNAGNYTVAGVEPIANSVEFVKPFFNNPVVVGPNAQNIDFMVGTNVLLTSFIAEGATWKYLDNGSDQGTSWIAPAFNDSSWASGPAQLGYGDDGEVTTISYGGNSANKHITYYFRHSFNVASPAAWTNLLLSVRRDDGIIVYLNGTEVYRNNMPAGAVTYTTPASDTASDDGDDWLSANVSNSLLVAGANVIAAEVHQESPGSSDVTFALKLEAESVSSIQRGATVYIASPSDHSTYTSPATVIIGANANSTPNAVTSVEIYAGNTLLVTDSTPPYAAVFSNPALGSHVLRAVSVDSGGIRRTSAPVNITVSAPVPAPISLSLIPTGSVWRYFCQNVGAPAGWQNINFADGTWSSGPARLGFGGSGLSTTFNGGPSGARYSAAYFRRAFVLEDPSATTNLNVVLARDDGAVVYLNGAEVLRHNIQNGIAVTYSTLATNAPDNGNTYFSFDIPVSGVVHGTNVVAVEVHQTSVTSSDMVFDFGLSALVASNRARGCWLASPANGGSFNVPGTVQLDAEVVAGGTLGVTHVQFYANGALIGQDTSYPFSFTWNNPAGGNYALNAVAYDSAGAPITSASVNITVSGGPTGQALVSFGELWKYLDDGSDQGTAWRTSAFNDNNWHSGPARLGYGGDGELTTVSFGTNPNFKHVTTYFRKKFSVANPGQFNALLLRLVRDDGAAVYLNGLEIFRNNLLAGPISYNSLATANVSGADETTPIDVTLPLTALLPGVNTLAVEVHQDNITSSDVGFDLALLGLRNTNTSDGVYLTSPANGANFNMPASVPLSAYAASSGGAITLVEYFAGNTKVGQAVNSPYAATWNGAAAGNYALTAVATYGGGLRMTSAPVSIVVGAAPAPVAPVFATYFDFGSAWKYWDSTTPVGANWTALGFDDSAWPVGNARFGWGFDGESTLLTSGRITHYFRKDVAINNGSALETLTFRAERDDGIVVYFNGLEIFRTNMPATAITPNTLATSAINTPDETIPVEYTVSTIPLGLLNGTNVVAVELHQNSQNSSDASFDMALTGVGTTDPRLYIGTPRNNSIGVFGAPIRLEAHAQAATGRTLTAVEFYGNGTKLGEANAFPYRFDWSGATTGAWTIVARSIDNLGHSLTSAPVQISVGYQPVTLTLIPAGSVWKYRDDGSNQGTTWAQPGFNDAAWMSGPAELGYGDLSDGRPEVTVICCSNAAVKSITSYFRHQFEVPPATYITNLSFLLLRDDGAVVWLNGTEAYRSNMPATPINYLTPASSGVGNNDEATFFLTSLTITNLPSGTNLVAVEIHQNNNTSSDVSFDLELIGTGYLMPAMNPQLSVSEVGGQLRIAWPASATGYQLYYKFQLDASPWQPVGIAPTHSNGQNVITVQMGGNAGFYRLQK